MKCLIAMLLLAGSLSVGLGETVSAAPAETAGSGPVSTQRASSHPSYIFLGVLSLVSLLAWRRRQQARG